MTRALWRFSLVLAVVLPVEYAVLFLFAPNRLAEMVVYGAVLSMPISPWW